MQQLEDILIFQNILENIEEPEESVEPGRLVAEVGRYFMEAAYACRPLEQEGPERLVVNLHCFDCFTFVENCLALALMIPTRKRSWNDFTDILTRIRYRGGIVNGYASRLHYFSEWLADNVKKGFLREVTCDIACLPYTKDIDFMTKHPDLYPPLADPATLGEIAEFESQMPCQDRFYVPAVQFGAQERNILEGDIIGITSATPGLDVQHAGIAVRRGRAVHLLHASEPAGQVVISTETLENYLLEDETRTGIMVGRIGTIS